MARGIDGAEGDEGRLCGAKRGGLPNDWPAELHIDLVARELVEALIGEPRPIAAQTTVGAVEVIQQRRVKTDICYW